MSRKRKVLQRKLHRPPNRLVRRLEKAIELEESGRLEEARGVLLELDQEFAGQPAILERLADLHADLGDLLAYSRVCDRLARLSGPTPELLVGSAGGYLKTCPGLAVARFRQFLAAAPQHEKASEARRVLGEILRVAPPMLQEMGLPAGDEGLELLAMHEEALLLVEEGEHAAAGRLLDALVGRCPTFQRALNNRTIVAIHHGPFSAASRASLRALENGPEDYHALGNRVRCLLAEGRPAEALDLARRLARQDGPEPDRPAKTAEALAAVGEDAGVLEVARRERRPDPLVKYLAAVALARLGKDEEARRALSTLGATGSLARLAADNLEDLAKPAGERNGPFYFDLKWWVPTSVIVAGARLSGRNACRRHLAENPELCALAEVALDRGDPGLRSLVLELAEATRDDRLMLALEPFARGRRGTDAHRMRAARLLVEEGRLPSRLQMYVEGSPLEVLLRQFQVRPNSRYRHSARVQRLVDDLTPALHRGDGPRAERLAREALSLEPGVPDLRNNLSAALSLQGRDREAEALLDELIREHPEYPMPHVQRAMAHLDGGRVQQASEALATVIDAPWLSINEFAALCMSSFEIELERRDPVSAEAWVDRLDQVVLNHPCIPDCRRRLQSARSSHARAPS